MVCQMKTTLNIDDAVMRRLREEAARRGTTMTALVEAGIMRVLEPPAPYVTERDALPELPQWNSGGAMVDVANRDELYAAMDES